MLYEIKDTTLFRFLAGYVPELQHWSMWRTAPLCPVRPLSLSKGSQATRPRSCRAFRFPSLWTLSLSTLPQRGIPFILSHVSWSQSFVSVLINKSEFVISSFMTHPIFMLPCQMPKRIKALIRLNTKQ